MRTTSATASPRVSKSTLYPRRFRRPSTPMRQKPPQSYTVPTRRPLTYTSNSVALSFTIPSSPSLFLRSCSRLRSRTGLDDLDRGSGEARHGPQVGRELLSLLGRSKGASVLPAIPARLRYRRTVNNSEASALALVSEVARVVRSVLRNRVPVHGRPEGQTV